MTFQPEAGVIRWRLHLCSAPETVFRFLSTDEGRAAFWAESAVESNGSLHFTFPNGQSWVGKILENDPPRRYRVNYYGDSITTFELADDGSGGTDLTLTDRHVPQADHSEVTAGWVSVLLALKAAADFGVDLRNHDPSRSWEQGFAEN